MIADPAEAPDHKRGGFVMSKTMPYTYMSATTLAAIKEFDAEPLLSATAMLKDMYISPRIFQLEIECVFHG